MRQEPHDAMSDEGVSIRSVGFDPVETMKRIAIAFILLTGSVSADDVLHPASERFAERESVAVPDFQRHVVPLLGRLGCNAAKCHGSFQGQGGFRLSLFGFDFR